MFSLKIEGRKFQRAPRQYIPSNRWKRSRSYGASGAATLNRRVKYSPLRFRVAIFSPALPMKIPRSGFRPARSPETGSEGDPTAEETSRSLERSAHRVDIVVPRKGLIQPQVTIIHSLSQPRLFLFLIQQDASGVTRIRDTTIADSAAELDRRSLFSTTIACSNRFSD